MEPIRRAGALSVYEQFHATALLSENRLEYLTCVRHEVEKKWL